MSRLCLAGILAVALVLVAGPILTAADNEGAGADQPKRVRGAGAEGERPKRPRVEVSEENLAKMKAEIEKLDTAIDALQKKAVDVLGDERNARMFVMQTMMRKLRPQGAKEGEKAGAKNAERAKKRQGAGGGFGAGAE